MHQVVAGVLDERLVTVRGAPGIGKTALATAAAHYLHARRAFRDGVFWVSLRGAASGEAARALIASALDI
jgi:predicted ATPase